MKAYKLYSYICYTIMKLFGNTVSELQVSISSDKPNIKIFYNKVENLQI